ncbi:MerR family transcriptional regulator [Kitasatospora sp. SUK 42]|uniref:MerR family transcriptional regulator n=1 Tax=Kitasatospora sp. SUK 42 TaxID=1588882 RepID=UPI0018CBDFBE|nr:MerR family transcriptional regulator [Kitasatospora sp. SUK 42]MBV2155473.1 MerR family transcriptional regulator [Kitasatospora sp. SUK 42]
MNGDTLHSIGELARRTGLTVKTVRFYSDQGIVSPADRNPAGHRRYGADAVVRLDLVRTLRELGLGLPAIRQVLERELTLPEVAAAHAEAIEVRIRVLRLRQSVLRAVARRGATAEELTGMHRLARLTESERERLIGEFLTEVFGGVPDEVFGGVRVGGEFAGVARSLTPELPEEPSAGQVEAWVELARLAGDAGFRELLRGLTEGEVAEGVPGSVPRPGLAVLVGELAGPAVAAGVAPGSAEAAGVVAVLLERYAGLAGAGGVGGVGGVDGVDGSLRARLVERLRAMADPRRERYLELLAVVNGWAPPRSSAEVLDWAVRALAWAG